MGGAGEYISNLSGQMKNETPARIDLGCAMLMRVLLGISFYHKVFFDIQSDRHPSFSPVSLIKRSGPGSDSSPTAGGDAMVTVLEGTGRFAVGDEVFLLNESETLIMPKDIPHVKSKAERSNMKPLIRMAI